MWGIRLVLAPEYAVARFIPTRVGNTTESTSLAPENSRFIPTRVGNTQTTVFRRYIKPGSSPRVWGIRPSLCYVASPGPVHPHACGEYVQNNTGVTVTLRFIPTRVGNTIAIVNLLIFNNGSSPRVWGIRSERGNVGWRKTVHPHACGEYAFSAARPSSNCGSSPRVWGIRLMIRQCRYYSAVHPHACGEYDRAKSR